MPDDPLDGLRRENARLEEIARRIRERPAAEAAPERLPPLPQPEQAQPPAAPPQLPPTPTPPEEPRKRGLANWKPLQTAVGVGAIAALIGVDYLYKGRNGRQAPSEIISQVEDAVQGNQSIEGILEGLGGIYKSVKGEIIPGTPEADVPVAPRARPPRARPVVDAKYKPSKLRKAIVYGGIGAVAAVGAVGVGVYLGYHAGKSIVNSVRWKKVDDHTTEQPGEIYIKGRSKASIAKKHLDGKIQKGRLHLEETPGAPGWLPHNGELDITFTRDGQNNITLDKVVVDRGILHKQVKLGILDGGNGNRYIAGSRDSDLVPQIEQYISENLNDTQISRIPDMDSLFEESPRISIWKPVGILAGATVAGLYLSTMALPNMVSSGAELIRLKAPTKQVEERIPGKLNVSNDGQHGTLYLEQTGWAPRVWPTNGETVLKFDIGSYTAPNIWDWDGHARTIENAHGCELENVRVNVDNGLFDWGRTYKPGDHVQRAEHRDSFARALGYAPQIEAVLLAELGPECGPDNDLSLGERGLFVSEAVGKIAYGTAVEVGSTAQEKSEFGLDESGKYLRRQIEKTELGDLYFNEVPDEVEWMKDEVKQNWEEQKETVGGAAKHLGKKFVGEPVGWAGEKLDDVPAWRSFVEWLDWGNAYTPEVEAPSRAEQHQQCLVDAWFVDPPLTTGEIALECKEYAISPK